MMKMNAVDSSNENDGLLRIGRRGQKSPRPSTILWIVVIVSMVSLRLINETRIIRQLSFVTSNEQQHGGRGDENSSLDRTNSKLVVSPKDCDRNGDFLTRMPTTVCSGSTFEIVPSATNLLLPLQTRKQYHGCYETTKGHAFHDKTNENHNYSNGNYILHILGDGACNQDGFDGFPDHVSKNVIVTAYYEIPSKHPPSKYHEWMGNFLSVYRDPMVIFTSPDLVDLLASLRRRNETENCEESCDPSPVYFDTIIVSLPLEELPLARLYPKTFWIDQLDRDPQSNIHSPLRGDPRMQGKFESGELYWIWLSKVWFVVESTRIILGDVELEDAKNSTLGSEGFSNSGTAVKNEDYDRDVFAWIDIGSFRNEDPTHKNQSSTPLLLRHPEVVPASEMLFWSHSSAHSSPSSDSTRATGNAKSYAPIPPRDSPYFDDKSLEGGRYFFHSGAHFAGRPKSIARFYRQFLRTIDVFVERNLTLADDQAVMQSSCLSYFYGIHPADGCERRYENICVYATRDMVGGKSKWFGLAKLLQTGLEESNQATRGVDRSDNIHDLYWKPPQPEYYHKEENQSIGGPSNCSVSS